MRIYMSVDMEGITGVAVGKQVTPAERDYMHACGRSNSSGGC